MALLLEEGRADILLSFFHPDIGVNLSEKDFQCLVAAQEVLIPVCKPDASGNNPLFRLPGTKRRPLPLLSYLPTLMMGKVLDRHLLKKADSYRLQRVLVGDFAEALLEHAFLGEGIAWLPQRLAADALRAKRLVHAGSAADEIPLEVRLYCHQKNRKPLVAKLWHSLSSAHLESPATAKG
jgi:DNA-binding transcriptional LysR family regulator